ncbi:MAG: hypothetical protein ACRDD8_10565 [Bacteroidales bacterium]
MKVNIKRFLKGVLPSNTHTYIEDSINTVSESPYPSSTSTDSKTFETNNHIIEYKTDTNGEETVTVYTNGVGEPSVMLWSTDMRSSKLLQAISMYMSSSQLSILEKIWVVVIDKIVDFGDGGTQISYLRNGKDKVFVDICVMNNWLEQAETVNVNTDTDNSRLFTRRLFPSLPIDDTQVLLTKCAKSIANEIIESDDFTFYQTNPTEGKDAKAVMEDTVAKSLIRSFIENYMNTNSPSVDSNVASEECGAAKLIAELYVATSDNKGWELRDAKSSIYDYLTEVHNIKVLRPKKHTKSGMVEHEGYIEHTKEDGTVDMVKFNKLSLDGWETYNFSDYTKREFELIVDLLAVKSYLFPHTKG